MPDKTPYKAYSLLDTKEYQDDKQILTGIATSASVDRMGDIIEMDGVEVASDIPLFLYHDSTKTVGRAKFGKPTKKGIPFEARMPKVMEAGALKDRIDEAWQMVRYGLITAVSIGFNAREYSFIEGGGVRFTGVEVLELSLVPVPAQPDAVIQGIKSGDPAARAALISQIKSLDQEQRRAASGARALPVVRLDPLDLSSKSIPGVTGQATTRRKGVVYLNR